MDHEKSIDELLKEVESIKSLLSTKQQELNNRIVLENNNKKLKLKENRKAKIDAKINRLFALPKDIVSKIGAGFSRANQKMEQIIQSVYSNKAANNIRSSAVISCYDPEVENLLSAFAENLKRQQEMARREELRLKKEKKHEITRESARVTLSPKLLMNKMKKNFNKAKIAVMTKATDLSYKYGERQEIKRYERDQELAEDLQSEVEEERAKQRKADFKAALKDQRREEKLHLKEERKIKVEHAKAMVIAVPFVLTSGIKRNFNKAKIALMVKANELSSKYAERKEIKNYERDQKLAEDLQREEQKEITKQRKADFKAALREENKEKREMRKQNIVSSLAHVATLPKSAMDRVRAGFSRVSSSVQSKYGELYAELMDKKEARRQIKDQELAEDLQMEVEEERVKQRKADFKAAIKEEKREQREKRHKAILDMIKALDEEQQQELAAQQAEISSLRSEIMYNINESGGRRR